MVAEILKVHDELHKSVRTAEYYQRNDQNAEAKKYFNSVIKTKTDIVLSRFDEFSAWFEKDLQVAKNASHIFHNETMGYLGKMGTLFTKAITESKQHIMTDEVLLSEAAVTRNGVITFNLLASIIALIIAIMISKSLVEPILRSVKFAERVSNGDLTAQIDIDQKDEIGDLAFALKNMTKRLRSIVENIKSSADNIASASSQLSSGAQQVSSGVSEQAASTEEVSSSMEQMVANIQQNSSNAAKTREISLNSAKAMKKVASASDASMRAVDDIHSKIGVVVKIAEKTDLLAINAAVERNNFV